MEHDEHFKKYWLVSRPLFIFFDDCFLNENNLKHKSC